MPLEKQSLNNFLPNGFETLNQEGYKENFSADKIAVGYEKDVPDIVSGPNLNNLIDVVGKNTNVLSKFMDFIKNMPVNNTLKVNSANQLDYEDVSDLNNKVSKSGDTMTGNLTIQKSDPRLYIDSKDITQGEAPTTTEYSTLMFRDKNQKILGQLNIGYNSNGSKGLNLTAYSSNGSVNSSLRIGYDENDNVYTGAPTPPTGDDTTKIATTAWVNRNAVNVNGDTMTGTLTSEANNGAEIHLKGIGNNNWLTIKGTVSNYDYNDYANVPTETLRNLRLISYDKNNQYYFYQQVSAEKVRNICAFLVKRKLTDGTEKQCSFALRVQDNGANTLLINGQPLVDYVIAETKSGVTKTRTWASGFKECWFQGIIGTNSEPATLTMPITFSDRSYYVNGNYGNGFQIELEKGWVVYPITVVPTSTNTVMAKASGPMTDIVCRFYACGY